MRSCQIYFSLARFSSLRVHFLICSLTLFSLSLSLVSVCLTFFSYLLLFVATTTLFLSLSRQVNSVVILLNVFFSDLQIRDHGR